MIIRNVGWILLLAFHLFALIAAQNDDSFDNNDWIPITPSSLEAEAKKAQGRVLNLDTPTQKFFPDYARKKPHRSPPPLPPDQQYLRETVTYQQKPRIVKNNEPYKFENVLPARLQPIRSQYYQTDYLPQPQPYVQPQPQPQVTNNNYYNVAPQQELYSIPLNRTFQQQPLNPAGINQEVYNLQKNVRPAQDDQKENVQLLYVPLENLKPNQPPPPPPIYQQNPFVAAQYPQKQHQLETIENDFVKQALAAHQLQQQFQLGQTPLYLTQPAPIVTTTQTPTTTPARKRKPHQPPLAVYMEKAGPVEVKDVLKALKNAKTIAVQDAVTPNSPEVFVGPSNLEVKDGYTKFPLPYLSSVEGNRIERKVDDLPFFVAPLSYKTPDGYSKIPLPSPHVGSVVVNTKEELHEKLPVARPTQIVPNQISFDGKGNAYLPNQGEFVPYQNLQQNQYLPNYQTQEAQREQFYQQLVQQPYSTPQFQTQTVTPKSQYSESATRTQYSEPATRTQYSEPATRTQYSEPATRTQFRSSTTEEPTQKTVTQVYEQPIRTTESVPVVSQNQYFSPTPNTQQYQEYRPNNRQNPLQQYELHQINEFIEEGTEEPSRSTSQNYEYEAPTTQRIQPRQRSRKTTTLRPISREPDPTERYTVLEEFSIRQKPTTVKYSTTVETIPANVYKLNPEPESTYQDENHELKQHVLNQEMMDQEILNSRVPSTIYQDDSIAYKTHQEPTFQITRQRNQELPQLVKVSDGQSDYQDYQPLVYNRGQNEQEPEPQTQFLPGLINNLQDQAVRPLLTPNLLVPTTEKVSTTAAASTTEEIRTEAPKLETTTPKRTRGRQRVTGSRYNTASTTPAPRRSVRTRRPTTQRTTVVVSTTNYDEVRKSSPQQNPRFRTRGRTPTTERVSEEFKQPELVGGFQASSGNPKSFMQFERTVDNQEVITVRTNDDKSIKEYHQVYTLPIQAQEESASLEPMVNVRITHPTTSRAIYEQETTTKAAVRPKGRTRVRTRPVGSTLAPSTTQKATEEGEEEFYGFIRQPSFNTKPVAREEQSQVQFVGELRPKYTTQAPETARPRTRVRTRPSSAPSTTRRTITRGRGSSHYKSPNKKENDEDDVAGGNYPASYLRTRQPVSEKSNFHITVGPDEEEDQEPQLSIYRPKLASPEWVEASALPTFNDLPMEDKKMSVETNSQEAVTGPEDDLETGEEVTTEGFETTTLKRNTGRRRGVWKLVKQRPLDQIEGAESQNYKSVLNSFEEIEKAVPKTTTEKVEAEESSTESSIFDTLYSMFGMEEKSTEKENNKTVVTVLPTVESVTTVLPTFPEEYADSATTTESVLEVTTSEEVETTTPELVKVDNVGVEPWEMKQQFKTSTSTEISHETEICYKGKCIKSKDKEEGELFA